MSKIKLFKDISKVIFGEKEPKKAAVGPVGIKDNPDSIRVGSYDVEVLRKGRGGRLSLTLQPSGRVRVSASVKTADSTASVKSSIK